VAESFKRKRIIYLIASLIICLFAGIGYAWSVFQNPFIRHYGWNDSAVALTYTITVLCSTLTSLLLGSVIRKLGIQRSVLIGGIMLGLGLFLTGFMNHSIWELYLFYGFLTGVGTGLVYPQAMSYVVKLFPEKPGVASGLGTAAYGAGSMLWAPVVSALIHGLSLQMAFRIIGVIFLLVIAVGSFFMKNPPDEFRILMVGGDTATSVGNGMNRAQMVKTGMFYLLAAIFSLALIAGVIVISQASSILQSRTGIGETAAAVLVSVFAAANMAGRFIWGSISDKAGRSATLKYVLIVCTVSMALMALFTHPVLSCIFMAITASCYGGTAALITPIVSDVYGPKYITENYGVMYMVFGIASLIGPLLATSLKDLGSAPYTVAFIIAAILTAIGLILTFFVKIRPYNSKL